MSSFQREMGNFLCRHGNHPFTEAVDAITNYDLDVRQEAAMRSMVALRRKGEACKNDSELMTAMNSHVDVSAGAYKFSKLNAVIKLHYKSPKLLHIRNDADLDYLLDTELKERQKAFEGLDDFSQVEDGFTSSRLATLVEKTGPKEKQAIALMLKWQEMKEAGIPRSKAMKHKLKRLRKATGLPLIPTLL